MRISQTDKEYLDYIRSDIRDLIRRAARFDGDGARVLEIGPGGYSDVKEAFVKARVFTLDRDENTNPDIVSNITRPFAGYMMVDGSFWNMAFDVVVCTDVLEHVTRPWDAVRNIRAAMATGGHLILSTPLNFRIHGMGGYDPGQGPAPDYWRFTESGLRLLLGEFEILEFNALESDRGLFPIHYSVIAKKK